MDMELAPRAPPGASVSSYYAPGASDASYRPCLFGPSSSAAQSYALGGGAASADDDDDDIVVLPRRPADWESVRRLSRLEAHELLSRLQEEQLGVVRTLVDKNVICDSGQFWVGALRRLSL